MAKKAANREKRSDHQQSEGLTDVRHSIDGDLLGYTVIADLDSSIEIDKTELDRLKTLYGFDQFTPTKLEPAAIIKRGISAWLKELSKGKLAIAGFDEEDGKKSLVRQIKTPDKTRVFLGLVKENIDLEELGLDYLTNLRVCFKKPDKKDDADQGQLMLTVTDSGSFNETYYPDITESNLLDSLRQHVAFQGGIYKSLELRRMIVEIVESLHSRNIRNGGGVYFVPEYQADDLQRLNRFMHDLKSHGPKTTLLHLPVINEANSKQQLATNTHESFMQRVIAYKEDIGRFATANRKRGIKLETMQERITLYQQLSDELTLYQGLLGTRVEDVQAELTALESQAQEIIDLYAKGQEIEATETAEQQQKEDAQTVAVLQSWANVLQNP